MLVLPDLETATDTITLCEKCLRSFIKSFYQTVARYAIFFVCSGIYAIVLSVDWRLNREHLFIREPDSVDVLQTSAAHQRTAASQTFFLIHI